MTATCGFQPQPRHVTSLVHTCKTDMHLMMLSLRCCILFGRVFAWVHFDACSHLHLRLRVHHFVCGQRCLLAYSALDLQGGSSLHGLLSKNVIVALVFAHAVSPCLACMLLDCICIDVFITRIDCNLHGHTLLWTSKAGAFRLHAHGSTCEPPMFVVALAILWEANIIWK